MNQPEPQEEQQGEESTAAQSSIKKTVVKMGPFRPANQANVTPPTHTNLQSQHPPLRQTMMIGHPNPAIPSQPTRNFGPHYLRSFGEPGHCCGVPAPPPPQGLSQFQTRTLQWAASMTQWTSFLIRDARTFSLPLPVGFWVYEVKKSLQPTSVSRWPPAQILSDDWEGGYTTFFCGGEYVYPPTRLLFQNGSEDWLSRSHLKDYSEELTISCDSGLAGHCRMGIRVWMRRGESIEIRNERGTPYASGTLR
ncbi:hypothetical protein VTL71DRAFT_1996 [Oculimacula yallundae]|uniref:Uncharacterized protein n=1 Tax=Oculimacula yallundae TaxID=86028 RepID=A0ABR4CCA1_9HELO